MPRKVSDERKRFWRDVVERQPTSGLNIAQFCAEAGVSQNAFYVWKKRLLTTTQQDRTAMSRRKHRRKKAGEKSLVPVRIIPDVSHQPSGSSWSGASPSGPVRGHRRASPSDMLRFPQPGPEAAGSRVRTKPLGPPGQGARFVFLSCLACHKSALDAPRSIVEPITLSAQFTRRRKQPRAGHVKQALIQRAARLRGRGPVDSQSQCARNRFFTSADRISTCFFDKPVANATLLRKCLLWNAATINS
jgi:hypothetical protein